MYFPYKYFINSLFFYEDYNALSSIGDYAIFLHIDLFDALHSTYGSLISRFVSLCIVHNYEFVCQM